MSASREKKERQGAGSSPRETQAQKEQAAYRRKVRTYTAIGVVVAVLVAALLIWNSGIFQRGQTAVTVGDTKYSVADLSYYYQYAKYSANQFYYMYNMSSYIPADSDIQDQETGKTWREYYLDLALDAMTEDTALYDEAVKNGWSEKNVTDDVQETIESVKSSASTSGYGYGAYLKAQYGKYMTTGAYKSILTRAALAQAYKDDHSDSLSYTEDEIQAYYEENKDSLDTLEYSYLYFTPEAVEDKDADGNELSDEEKEKLESEALTAAKEKADEALEALESGSQPAELIEQYELTSSNSADHSVSVGSSISSAAVYRDKLFSMADGETALVEDGESGYYVVVLHSRYLDQTPNADVRHILVRAETATDSDGNTVAATDEAWTAAETKANDILAEYEADEHTEEAFTALAKKYSEDVDANGELNNDGLYENISKTDGYVTEFLDWIFAPEGHSVGDTGIVKHDGGTSGYSGYHIMYYAADSDPDWKDTSVSTLRSNATTEWVDGLSSGYTAAQEKGADLVGQ